MNNHAQPNVQKILLGNKCDMEDKKLITTEKGQETADQYGMKFFETSAKTGQGIKDGFETIAA